MAEVATIRTVFTIHSSDTSTDDEAVQSLLDWVLTLDVRVWNSAEWSLSFTFDNIYIGSTKSYLDGFRWVGWMFLGP